MLPTQQEQRGDLIGGTSGDCSGSNCHLCHVGEGSVALPFVKDSLDKKLLCLKVREGDALQHSSYTQMNSEKHNY